MSLYSQLVKIGFTANPPNLFPRYKTYLGRHLVIYVWDVYFDAINLETWNALESKLLDKFSNYRVFAEEELFYLYQPFKKTPWWENPKDNLIDCYRDLITEYCTSSEISRKAYHFGIKKRWQSNGFRTELTEDMIGKTRGNLLFQQNCESIYNTDSDVLVSPIRIKSKELKEFLTSSTQSASRNVPFWEQDSPTNDDCNSDDDIGRASNIVIDDIKADENHLSQVSEDKSTRSRKRLRKNGVHNEEKTRTPPVALTSSTPITEHALTSWTPITEHATYSSVVGEVLTTQNHNHGRSAVIANTDGGEDRVDAIVVHCASKGTVVKHFRSSVVLDDDDIRSGTKVQMYDPQIEVICKQQSKNMDQVLKQLGFYKNNKSIKVKFEKDLFPKADFGSETFEHVLSSEEDILKVNFNAFSIRSVKLLYRLHHDNTIRSTSMKRIAGTIKLFEYKLIINNDNDGNELIIQKNVVDRTSDRSLVVVEQQSPRHQTGDSVVILRHFKLRTYREAVLMLLCLTRVYASTSIDRILRLPYSKKSDYIWDDYEMRIVKNLGFTRNNASYDYIIPKCIRPSVFGSVQTLVSQFIQPLSIGGIGGTLKQYENFLRKTEKASDLKYTDEAFEKVLREARARTAENAEWREVEDAYSSQDVECVSGSVKPKHSQDDVDHQEEYCDKDHEAHERAKLGEETEYYHEESDDNEEDLDQSFEEDEDDKDTSDDDNSKGDTRNEQDDKQEKAEDPNDGIAKYPEFLDFNLEADAPECAKWALSIIQLSFHRKYRQVYMSSNMN